MEANFNIRQTYAIALLLDDSIIESNLSTLISKFTDINKFAVIKGEDDFIIKSTSPTERSLKFYIGIGRRVPKTIKDELIKSTIGQLYLPNARLFWFAGQDYSKENIENWLRKYANQDGCSKIWIININTDLTGSLLSKFGDI
jgi:hypothetical protein